MWWQMPAVVLGVAVMGYLSGLLLIWLGGSNPF